MNCEDVETMMADALGDEQSLADRSVFEAHLAECDTCRRKYQARSQTVATLRTLPGPRRVTIQRRGNRLVIDGLPGGRAPKTWGRPRALFRSAAGIFIAFTAGYATHLGLMMAGSGTTDSRVVSTADHDFLQTEHDTLQSSLVNVHARNPGRSDLAKGLIAMLASGQ